MPRMGAPDPFVRRTNTAGEHEPFALTTLATFDSLRLYECVGSEQPRTLMWRPCGSAMIGRIRSLRAIQETGCCAKRRFLMKKLISSGEFVRACHIAGDKNQIIRRRKASVLHSICRSVSSPKPAGETWRGVYCVAQCKILGSRFQFELYSKSIALPSTAYTYMVTTILFTALRSD